MCELGNDVINRVYEAKLEKMGIKKPQPGQRYGRLNVLLSSLATNRLSLYSSTADTVHGGAVFRSHHHLCLNVTRLSSVCPSNPCILL